MSEMNRTELGERSPSAKIVYKTLEHTGEATQQQIAEESLLSPRTVRYALQRLEEINAVTGKSISRHSAIPLLPK